MIYCNILLSITSAHCIPDMDATYVHINTSNTTFVMTKQSVSSQ